MRELSINTTKKLTVSAMVIALYVVVMYCTQSFAFGAVQVRIATALYSLSYIFPFLVLPLGVSNLLSNILGGMGLVDMIGGCGVGIITSFCVYLIKKNNMPVYLAALPIIFFPGLIVPIWLTFFTGVPYGVLAFNLCLGQIPPAVLGVVIIKALEGKLNKAINIGE